MKLKVFIFSVLFFVSAQVFAVNISKTSVLSTKAADKKYFFPVSILVTVNEDKDVSVVHTTPSLYEKAWKGDTYISLTKYDLLKIDGRDILLFTYDTQNVVERLKSTTYPADGDKFVTVSYGTEYIPQIEKTYVFIDLTDYLD